MRGFDLCRAKIEASIPVDMYNINPNSSTIMPGFINPKIHVGLHIHQILQIKHLGTMDSYLF